MRRETDYLRDMLDSALRVQRELAGKSFTDFLAGEMLQDAVVLRLLIIGEAAKQITPVTQAMLPALPFDDIAKMRNVMVHVYWRINYKIVWDTATQEVRTLIEHLTPHLGAGDADGVAT